MTKRISKNSKSKFIPIKFFLKILVIFSMIIIILWAIINIYKTVIIVIQETIKTTDYLIAEEQKRDLARFEEKTIIAKKHIIELEEQLKNIKTGVGVRMPEKQKREMLKIAWELRKDSLRIGNSFINHENDLSVIFYPRKDEKIANKFKNYWATPILIDRVVDDLERIVYTPRGVDKFQLQKLQEDLAGAKRIVDQE